MDELPNEMLEVIGLVHKDTYSLRDVKDMAEVLTMYLVDKGFEVYEVMPDGSFTATKTEVL